MLPVLRAVAGSAADPPVHHLDGADRRLLDLGRSVGRGGDEGRVLIHAGHGQRVQGLELQGADAAEECGYPPVHRPDRVPRVRTTLRPAWFGDAAGDPGSAVGTS